jgi:hypothetical protein
MLLFDDAGDEEGASKPDGNKKVKEKIKFEVEASNLASKIDEFVRSKEIMTLKNLEAKSIFTEKNEMKRASWQAISDLEERRLAIEKKKAMSELIVEVNSTMMMYPNTMDAYTREWWDMKGFTEKTIIFLTSVL